MSARSAKVLPAVAAALALLAFAGRPSGAAPWEKSRRLVRVIRDYDPARVRTLTGVVDNVYVKVPSTAANPDALGYHIILKAGDETRDIHLGPAWFIKSLDGRIGRGDTVTVTGAETGGHEGKDSHPGPPEIRAAEVSKDGVTVLRLRREDGRPLWSGF